MKKQVDEKKKKKVSKKIKKARSIVMMLLLCVMLLSAATYAWFSLSNTARVNNLTMTVSEADGLRVALDQGRKPNENEWSGSIKLDDKYAVKGVLVPATSSDGKTFKRPEYDDDGKVKSVTAEDVVMLDKTNTDEKKEGHCFKYTFYMESLKDKAQIKLARGNDLDKESRTGTYLIQTKDGKSSPDLNAAATMRVSIIAGEADSASNNNYAVYEPASNVSATALNESQRSKALTVDNYNPNMITGTQKQTYPGGEFDSTGDKSGLIFTLEKDTPTLITLYVWIEGDDDDCINQIQVEELLMQLQFVKETSGN